MASDSNPAMGDVTFGQNISLSINTESRKEADRIFKSLSEGGNITMPMDKTFWGAYFGMLIDKFKIIWMVNCDE
jgi:PhnB protein